MSPHKAGRWVLPLLFTVLPGSLAQTAAPVSPPAAPASAPALSPERSAALTRGRQLLSDFYAVRLDALWQSFTPEVRAQWGSLAAFRAFRLSGVSQYGAQRELVRERTLTEDGETFYVRSATFEKAPKQVWSLVIGFGPDGRVSTFGILLEEDRSGGQVA
ncbi:hypothetical protein [Deinococcus sp. Leaf326]|uniref:hypothetical protein n=1 Tax=Deinococcus sp. Leaf326 TaxID=1736338 RepID=UPI0006F6A368|nr:hypothetical protein [Deinococcus sp. Leaf326]KQR15537.1 hypothetical protein ASF71_07770 [Deinococcus sp. Leaf326]